MREERHRAHGTPVTEANIQPVLETLLTVARQLLRGRHTTASARDQVNARHPHGVKPHFSRRTAEPLVRGMLANGDLCEVLPEQRGEPDASYGCRRTDGCGARAIP